VNEHRNERVKQIRIHQFNLPQTRSLRNKTDPTWYPHAFESHSWWKNVVITRQGATIPTTTHEPTDSERKRIPNSHSEVKYQMQPVTVNTQIPQNATELRTVNPRQLGAGIKSVSILRNGQFNGPVGGDSVERWTITDLFECTSYTVTRHGESYALTLKSGNDLIVADVEGTADIPDVAQKLAQFATTS
jgi:hypothetical protein